MLAIGVPACTKQTECGDATTMFWEVFVGITGLPSIPKLPHLKRSLMVLVVRLTFATYQNYMVTRMYMRIRLYMVTWMVPPCTTNRNAQVIWMNLEVSNIGQRWNWTHLTFCWGCHGLHTHCLAWRPSVRLWARLDRKRLTYHWVLHPP